MYSFQWKAKPPVRGLTIHPPLPPRNYVELHTRMTFMLCRTLYADRLYKYSTVKYSNLTL